MTAEKEVRSVLERFAQMRPSNEDRELNAVTLALLLEDVFGVVLRDEDMDLDLLTDASAVAALLEARGAVRQGVSG
ncbi:MAG: hypothetical protein IPJ14_14020 [Kineosporiaceae bacterium]|nr:hypothetical protein [Kineosporiaceae bacterium]MBK7623740.1 hypothetical protein [Kineosporiaceae bacterium]MBK8075701.1 hypothetical protein [Kineosporiaceae bacterium]